jgi:hypothetical protein
MENRNGMKAVGAMAFVLAGVGLLTGLRLCYGDPPPLSISRSNDTVRVSWQQTTNGWQLTAKGQWYYTIDSNGVVQVERTQFIHPSTNVFFQTNGSNIFVTLPIDPTVSTKFFFLEPTNSLPPFPPTEL